MKTLMKPGLSALALASLLALAACGGGGGGDGGSKQEPSTPPTTPTTPQDPASVPPSTTAPPSSYPAGDQRLAALDAMNAVRLKMGVGALKQDEKLDTAADNHLAYMKANSATGHLEIAGNLGFTGANPYDQVVATGGSKSQWIGQEVSSGAPDALSCVGGFMRSVYHLQGISSNQETVGISVRDNRCVINFGVVTGAKGGGYGLAQWGGQQMAASAMAYYPADSDRVFGTFFPGAESPNPAPDLSSAGHPIMFRVPAPEANDVLTVTSFTLIGPGGTSIPVRVLVPSKAKAGSVASAIEDVNIYAGVAFMLPTQPLGAGTYTATFNGARNGVPVTKSWSFTAF
ncbi:CAP domain-containing protein [Cupriavidus taiwanensis]|uniref:CAP domain-containing protein n=1 Tax=Cupriavidus taiwanensis TaxID=164546 RepID=UPI0025410D98|nr:CAP domain-containing protein [Cupriavidus taiwanensis]MDK3022930.1 CAP domain-containing protein [Cupriavidus taiwanensis]